MTNREIIDSLVDALDRIQAIEDILKSVQQAKDLEEQLEGQDWD